MLQTKILNPSPPAKFHIPWPSLSYDTIHPLAYLSTVHEHPTRASSTHKILTAPPSSCLRNTDRGMMNSYTWPRVNSVTEERIPPTLALYRPSLRTNPSLSFISDRIFTCWNRGYEGRVSRAARVERDIYRVGGEIVSRIALRCIRLLSFPWQPHCAGSMHSSCEHAGPVWNSCVFRWNFIHATLLSFASIAGWN